MIQNLLGNVSFGPGPVKTGAIRSAQLSNLLQMYTNTIFLTPDIHLPDRVDKESGSTVSKDLPKHQQDARDHAKEFIDEINDKMAKSLAGILGFSNLWKAMYDKLYKYASDIDNGDNATQFTIGLKILQNNIKKKSGDIKPIIESLEAFNTKITQDGVNFEQDHKNVVKALGGEHGEIANLKTELDGINQAIANDNTQIGEEVTGGVLGALMIVVGILGEFETEGLSTTLITGGLAVIGGAGGEIGKTVEDLNKQKEKLKNVTAELDSLKQVYSAVNTSNATIQHLGKAVNHALTAINDIHKGWNDLHDDFGEVIEALDQITPDMGTYLTNMLEAADKDWHDTHDLALGLQVNVNIPVTKEDHTGDRPKIAV
ncbi:HBL/NHE enterotoxin family protein [Brevibacillus laterosporus]|uniref:HBL/NHE enterotoxin family protein n=1 Tax=Brevibacillus laterosporus TaxID=1465 RepID=UPI0035A5EE76